MHDYTLVWCTKIETVYNPTFGNYLDFHVRGKFIIDEAEWMSKDLH